MIKFRFKKILLKYLMTFYTDKNSVLYTPSVYSITLTQPL